MTRVLLGVVLTVVLVACGGGSSSSKKPAAGSPDTVTIKGFAFGPGTLTVQHGARVTIVNSDTVDHTFTADDHKSFDTKHIRGGTVATLTAPAPGTYKYHCSIHEFMTATLVVT